MFVMEYNLIRDTYAVVGTAQEFHALLNIITVAKAEGTNFSNTEATIMYEIQRGVQNNVPGAQK